MSSIVIGNDHYNTLGIIRGLGEAGEKIYLILTEDKKSFVIKSRYIFDFAVCCSEKEIIDMIKKIGNYEEKLFLFPTSDYAAIVIDRNLGKLNKRIYAPNAEGNLSKFQDKYCMSKFAANAGMKVPAQMIVNLDGSPVVWKKFPAILKPVRSLEGKKADIKTVLDKDDLVMELNKFHALNYKQVLIEEFVHGKNEYMVEAMGYSVPGTPPVICGIIKKIREFPYINGSTSYGLLYSELEGVNENSIEKILEQCGYCGIFDIEYKFADGKMYFIEMNFRNGAPSYITKSIGNVIPLMWKKTMEGEVVLSKKINQPLLFMCEHMDILNMLKHNVIFRTWIKEFSGSVKVLWNAKDIMPTVYYYYYFSMGYLKRLIKR